jgi:hypothetical protein
MLDSHEIENKEGHLFDLAVDRAESRDISAAHLEEKETLRHRFLETIDPELPAPGKKSSSEETE